MIQEVKQTKEEKIEMYMKCTKKELASMLYEANRVLDEMSNGGYKVVYDPILARGGKSLPIFQSVTIHKGKVIR